MTPDTEPLINPEDKSSPNTDQAPDSQGKDAESTGPEKSLSQSARECLDFQKVLEEMKRNPETINDVLSDQSPVLQNFIEELLTESSIPKDYLAEIAEHIRNGLKDELSARAETRVKEKELKKNLKQAAAVFALMGASVFAGPAAWALAALPLAFRVKRIASVIRKKSKPTEEFSEKVQKEMRELTASELSTIQENLAGMIVQAEREFRTLDALDQFHRFITDADAEDLKLEDRRGRYLIYMEAARRYVDYNAKNSEGIDERVREKMAAAIAIHQMEINDTDNAMRTLQSDRGSSDSMLRLAQTVQRKYGDFFGASFERSMARIERGKWAAVGLGSAAIVTGLGIQKLLRSEWASSVPLLQEVMAGMSGLGLGIAAESLFRSRDISQFLKKIENEIKEVRDSVSAGQPVTAERKTHIQAIRRLADTLKLPAGLVGRMDLLLDDIRKSEIEQYTQTDKGDIAERVYDEMIKTTEESLNERQKKILAKINGRSGLKKVRTATVLLAGIGAGLALSAFRSNIFQTREDKGSGDHKDDSRGLGEEIEDVSDHGGGSLRRVGEAPESAQPAGSGETQPQPVQGESQLPSEPKPDDQSGETLSRLEEIGAGQGYEHAIRALLEEHPEEYGYDSERQGTLHEWSGKQAHRLAIDAEIVRKDESGQWVETRVRGGFDVGVQLEKAADGSIHVVRVNEEGHEYQTPLGTVEKAHSASESVESGMREHIPPPDSGRIEQPSIPSPDPLIEILHDSSIPAEEKINGIKDELEEGTYQAVGDYMFAKSEGGLYLVCEIRSGGGFEGTLLTSENFHELIYKPTPLKDVRHETAEQPQPVSEPAREETGEEREETEESPPSLETISDPTFDRILRGDASLSEDQKEIWILSHSGRMWEYGGKAYAVLQEEAILPAQLNESGLEHGMNRMEDEYGIQAISDESKSLGTFRITQDRSRIFHGFVLVEMTMPTE